MNQVTHLELQLPGHIIEAARSTQLLDSPAEESFDRLARLTSKLLNVPVSLVTVLDQDRQFFKSSVGLADPWSSQRETPLSHSFCQHVVCADTSLAIPDARLHEILKDSPAIPDIGVIAYAGVPLRLAGVPFGVLCAIDGQPREWTTEEMECLGDLAGSVMTEVELRMKNVQLNQLVERQNQFLGMAAHDLRTPLTVAQGYSQFLGSERAGLQPAHREMAQAVFGSCKFMLGLIEDLLDLQALKSGKLTLRRQSWSPYPLLARAVEIHQALGQPKDIAVSLAASSDLPVVMVDAQKIEQVLNNLLGNAMKYSPAESAVELKAQAENGRLRIEISDNGPGIPEKYLETIFEPFQRGDAHGQKGAGLGLAIVKRIVEAHAGKLTVRSKVGEGSTFIVELPLESG